MLYPAMITLLGVTASAQISPGAAGLPGQTNDPSARIAAPWDEPRQLTLMGKVVIAGGGALSEPARIERVCNGVARAEGFTDLKGNFSIIIGQEQTAMEDASQAPASGPLSANPAGAPRLPELVNCELRAALPGYRSDVVSLANRRVLDNPNVGTIFLHRESNTEGLTVSATTALAPKDARKAYEKGLDAERKNKIDEAQKYLEKSVAIYPKFASAWFELGKIYEQGDHIGLAGGAYRHSIGADSRFLQPYERLYMFAYNAGKWQDAADLSGRMLHLDPVDYPQAYYYNAVANLRLDRMDAAEKSAREAVRLDSAHKDAPSNYLLGFILARKADYAGAEQYLHASLEIEPSGKQAPEVRKLLGEVEHAAQAQQH